MIRCLAVFALLYPAFVVAQTPARGPNIVVLFADDLGYGDLGCYGHPTIRTPELDRMAAEGTRFTQFYCAAPVCTPSRAALLTGRLPIRSGMSGAGRQRVLYARSPGGLPATEVTIAELLKQKGYATACVGKWHLGHLPQHLPMRQGFDSYFGIPYSNDMKPTPLMRNDQILEEPAVQETLTARYTEEAVKFIRANRERPFFLYLAYTFPHVPLHVSEKSAGKSRRGLYGDVVEELDWSVGQILQTLREGLAGQTLVVFSSDNGPWLPRLLHGGSAGLLKDGKGSTWEGGMRVPGIFWWPGRIPAGTVCREFASTMDLLPTAAALAGVDAPKDRSLDGVNITDLLTRGQAPAERPFFYWDGGELLAVRRGPWKAHMITRPGYGPDRNNPKKHDPPLLFNLDHDPSETVDVAAEHPDVVQSLLAEVAKHRAGLVPVPSQLELEPLPASRAAK